MRRRLGRVRLPAPVWFAFLAVVLMTGARLMSPRAADSPVPDLFPSPATPISYAEMIDGHKAEVAVSPASADGIPLAEALANAAEPKEAYDAVKLMMEGGSNDVAVAATKLVAQQAAAIEAAYTAGSDSLDAIGAY